MGTGYEVGGTERLVCGAPPGVVPGGAGLGDFKPNIFLGQVSAWGATANFDDLTNTFLVPVGATDFSIEIWLNEYYGQNPPDTDTACGVSWVETTGPIYVPRSYVGDIGARPAAIYSDVDWGGANTSLIQLVAGFFPEGWHHYVANFDRNLNLIGYQDGIANGAGLAITNTNLGSPAFFVGCGGQDSRDAYDAVASGFTPDEWGYTHLINRIGPMAIHSRLLTVAEMQESTLNRTVQDLGAATYVRFDWRHPMGVEAWEFDRDNIIDGVAHQPFIRGIPVGAPIGTTVYEQDQTLNGRDYPIAVADAYGTTLATRAIAAYGVDEFFFHGGGV